VRWWIVPCSDIIVSVVLDLVIAFSSFGVVRFFAKIGGSLRLDVVWSLKSNFSMLLAHMVTIGRGLGV